jgi:Zn-dependent M16 (insulinase) family peptidase
VVAICDQLSKLKYSKALPYAFTEHGAIMAASVLNSAQPVEMSVFIVRAFVRLHQTIAEHKEIASKLQKLERRIAEHDEQILTLLEAIHQLMAPPSRQQKKIGFTIKERKASYGKRKTKKQATQKIQ